MSTSRDIPRQIGGYRVTHVLGQGAMGTVYHGLAPHTSAPVAIKTVNKRTAYSQRGIRREIAVLSRLSHPGIVQIVDNGTIDAIPWYAMSYLNQLTLEEHITLMHTRDTTSRTPSNTTLNINDLPPIDEMNAPLSAFATPSTMSDDVVRRQVRIAYRLLEALGHLHARGIVHRDIKPSNIFLMHDDQPVLVDFGLSHTGAYGMSRESMDDSLLVAGTPAYIAPEVIQGGQPDARADLYSAGCVLFELFSGIRPFLGPSRGQILDQHLTQQAPLVSDLRTDLPAPVVTLISQMLQKVPQLRLQNANQALTMLAPLLDMSEEPPACQQQLHRPRFTGRASALATLRQTIQADHSDGTMTVVLGRSGLGKTYLVREALRKSSQSFLVIPGRCVPVGPLHRRSSGALLHPFSELFESLADSCVGSLERTQTLIGNTGPLLEPFSNRIALLPGYENWVAPKPLEGIAERERTLAALQEVILRFSKQQKMILVIDDLQWADELTVALLSRLLGTLQGHPLHVIATCRTDPQNPAIQQLLNASTLKQLSLDALSREDIIALVNDMLGRPPPPALLTTLTAQAEGSPFYVAEYMRTASALGLLQSISDGDAAPSAALPQTLEALIVRRLSTLTPTPRAVVSMACVMGRGFDEAVVCQACGLEPQEMSQALEALEHQHFMAFSELGSLQFAHDKLSEVAYSELSAAERVSHHRAVATAAEVLHSDHLEAYYGALAHHWEQASEVEQAVHYLQLSAQAEFDQRAYEQAIRSAERLLELGSAGLEPRERSHWNQILGESHWSLGDMARCESYTLAAFADLGKQLPKGMAGWGLLILRELARQGTHLLGFGIGTVTDPQRRQDLQRLATASNTLCWRYLFTDKIPHILGLAAAATNWVEQSSPALQLSTPYGWLGYNAGAARLHGLAARYFSRAHANAAARHDLPGAVFTLLMEGLYQAGFGRFEQMLETSHQALKMLEQQGDPQNQELHLTMVGNASYYLGRFDDATTNFAAMYDLAQKRSNLQHEAWGLYAACWPMIALGQFAAAVPRLEAARALLDDNADLPSEIITTAMQAHCALYHQGDPAAARVHIIECADRIDRTKIANYPTAPAYGMAAQVAIALAEADPSDNQVAALARRLVRDNRWLTLYLPYSGGIARRVRGLLQGLDGSARAASTLRQAATDCDKLGMQYEAAQAWFALATRHASVAPDALAEAHRRLSKLKCSWHIQQLGLLE